MNGPEVTRRLQELDEYAFEHFVADLWERRGWDTEVTAESHDRGVDVIATRTVPYSEKEVIQAKRYRPGNRVGRPEIQQYASLTQQEPDADKVIVVCTSGFTDEALAVADETNVKCVDGVTIAEIVSELNATDLVKKYTDPVNADTIPSSHSSRKANSGNSTSNQDDQKYDNEEDPFTVVGRNKALTAELVGLERVEATISSGGLLSSATELDGIIFALKLFNQVNDPLFIRELDAFTIKDEYGNTYSPINLGRGGFGNNWKKHGGKYDDRIEELRLEAGSRVKYAVGVSLPSHVRVTEIILRLGTLNTKLDLDREAWRKIGDLPDEIKSSLSN